MDVKHGGHVNKSGSEVGCFGPLGDEIPSELERDLWGRIYKYSTLIKCPCECFALKIIIPTVGIFVSYVGENRLRASIRTHFGHSLTRRLPIQIRKFRSASPTCLILQFTKQCSTDPSRTAVFRGKYRQLSGVCQEGKNVFLTDFSQASGAGEFSHIWPVCEYPLSSRRSPVDNFADGIYSSPAET